MGLTKIRRFDSKYAEGMFVKAYSHPASASMSALTLRKGIITF